MRFLTVWSLIMVGSGALAVASAGDIYCNNQGHDCSDRPSPGATYVRTVNAAPTRTEPSSASANGTAPASTDSARARLSQDASRAALQKDVAASRAEQCKQAKDVYQKSVEARRVYRMNKAGEREYLSDTEAEQARLNARLDMERSCGGPAS